MGVLGIGSVQSNWLTKLAPTLRTIMGYFPKKNPRSYLSLNFVIFNNFDLLKIFSQCTTFSYCQYSILLKYGYLFVKSVILIKLQNGEHWRKAADSR